MKRLVWLIVGLLLFGAVISRSSQDCRVPDWRKIFASKGSVTARADLEWLLTELFLAHCHCESCRRATGAPVTTYVGFLSRDFRFTGALPASYHSSPGVTRTFCSRCGTPMTYEAESSPGEIHAHISTLEGPERYLPQRHVFTDEALPWLTIEDGLPRRRGLVGDASRDGEQS